MIKEYSPQTDSFNTDLKAYIDTEIDTKVGSLSQAATVAPLAQTISGTYDDAEVQAISDKVDAIIAALKAAGLMAT